MSDASAPPPAPKKAPWPSLGRMARRLAVAALVGYVLICVYLYSIQTRMIYVGMNYPVTTDLAIKQAMASGVTPWEHSTTGSTFPQGFVSLNFNASAPRGTIVEFHGNGEFAWMRPDVVEALTRRGFRVFLYEYPGYGGRPGTPSEAFIVPDAQALIRSLDAAGLGPVYVWGISLGSGVAAAVCADPTLPVHGLVLATPWDNLANVGLHLYPFLPVRMLLHDKYDSIGNLQHFPHPICVVYSENDEVIPPPLSAALYAGLPGPKKLITHAGAHHNDWPSSPELSWWDDALDFIAPK